MRGVIAVRVVAVALIVALVAGCVWAQGREGFWQALMTMASQPWGAVTLGDLYSGLLVVALWMAVREAKPTLLPLWWLGLLLLGNIATLAFLVRCTVGARDLREVMLGRGAR